MSGWTPGPWSPEQGFDGSWAVFAASIERDVPYTVDDARLIAAAPEMAELLQRVGEDGCYECTEFGYDLEGTTAGSWWKDHDCLRLEARTLLARIQGKMEDTSADLAEDLSRLPEPWEP